MPEKTICPNCRTAGLEPFYAIRDVPVHSVLLLTSQEEALNYPTGDIVLSRCDTCGFVTNIAFDPSLHEYSSRYEATQSYSPTFSAFSRRLAEMLIAKHDLRAKRIIEIGCGQGEFLNELCELGNNQGVGFDPAYIAERSTANTDRIAFIADFYSEKYSNYTADFFVCKMTLEHIDQTGKFLNTVRRAIGEQFDTTVFFQIPNATRVFRDLAFWDIYYEHCSYFSRASITYLFQQAGFNVIDVWTDYDDQYLMIDAHPSRDGASQQIDVPEEAQTEIQETIDYFIANYDEALRRWKDSVQSLHAQGKRVVIWGGGSKGVAFLTTLDIRNEIQYAVDINPHKNGMYMAGTGQQTVLPEFLKDYRPDVVIIMNPIYREEIRQMLDEMNLPAEIMTLE